MRARNSSSVRGADETEVGVGVEVGVAVGVGAGVCTGAGREGAGVGVGASVRVRAGVGVGVGVCAGLCVVTRRSRCVVCAARGCAALAGAGVVPKIKVKSRRRDTGGGVKTFLDDIPA
jgi:hypothetical protein